MFMSRIGFVLVVGYAVSLAIFTALSCGAFSVKSSKPENLECRVAGCLLVLAEIHSSSLSLCG